MCKPDETIDHVEKKLKQAGTFIKQTEVIACNERKGRTKQKVDTWNQNTVNTEIFSILRKKRASQKTGK